MIFDLKKQDINRKVDYVLNMDVNDVSCGYIPLVWVRDGILDDCDVEYEYDIGNSGQNDIDHISFISKSSKILLRMPKDRDINCSHENVDYGVILDKKISFAQRNDSSEVFKTSPYCCDNPIDMIIVELICESLIKKKKGNMK